MATYYVRTDGSDSNAGTGTGTGQAWATIGKALGASGIASGDTVYIKPGTYAEVVTVAVTPSATTTVIGDTDGAIFGSIGEVIWSGFTAGNDASPTGAPCNLSGKSYFTMRRITFYGDDIGGTNPSCVSATTATSTYCTFEQCVFHIQGASAAAAGSAGIRILVSNNVSTNWTIDRCVFVGRGQGIYLDIRSGTTGSDWNSQLDIKNCIFLNSVNSIGGASNAGANVTSRPSHGNITNCTFFGADYGVRFTNNGAWSTTNGIAVRNCLLYSSTTAALVANASGQITSDYNRLIDNVSNQTNVTLGTNDITAGAFELDFGAGLIQKAADRAFWMPSQTINPTADTTVQPSTDILGTSRTSTSTIGAYLDSDIIPSTGGMKVHPGMTGGIRG